MTTFIKAKLNKLEISYNIKQLELNGSFSFRETFKDSIIELFTAKRNHHAKFEIDRTILND